MVTQFIRIKNTLLQNRVKFISLCILVFTGFTAKAQLDISGPTSIINGNSYSYYPTYNGSSTYPYSGGYSYSISGGVVTGTSNTSKSGTNSGGILYSMGINVTWTSSTGTLSLYCGLGSKTITVNAVPALQGGTLSPASQTINYNTVPSTITGTAASGGAASPVYSYQWQSSADASTWVNISGATSTNYSPASLTQTIYYRRMVTETSTSATAYSNTASVLVYPQLTCSITPVSINLSSGGTAPVISGSVSGGDGTYSYQWQISSDNSTWTNTGTGTSSLSPGVLTATRYYRLLVTSNGATVTSNISTMSVCTTSTTIGPIQGATSCMIGSTIQLWNGNAGGSWTSSNTSVAKVDASGVVTGMGAGTAVITYTLTNACGSASAQSIITVESSETFMQSLGKGICDPVITDTISLVANTVKETKYIQDTLYSSTHSIKNVLALRVNEETTKYIPGDFTATVVVQLEYGHSSSDIYKVDSIKLSVNYTKNGGTQYNALNYFTFSGAEYTRVTVIRVDAPTTVNGVSFDTKTVLQLTNSLLATRYYKMQDNKIPVLTYNTPAGGATPDALTVNWQFPGHTHNNGVQLEWAWLENELVGEYNSNNAFDTSLLFKSNATRIDLAGGTIGGSYDIPLLYDGTGKLLIRVRGVNLMPSGSRGDGPWSGVQSYAFSGHSDSLNWQVTTSYAEEGKRKTVIQYYDGSLRGRQTVTKDNTTGNTVVAESMYDYQGRAVVQILPAPGISNIIAYTKNLNKFNTQADNTNPADFFDFTTVSLGDFNTPPLSTASGTSKYYSSNNPDAGTGIHKNIPDANGYPYTVTRYTPDGTGRVMRQGGVGDSLKMGSGHETKYFYGSPAQEELDALFGTEVGNYKHYFKNMMQDANGQMSISYVDMHGRTIATALAGLAPGNMQALNISDTNQYKYQAAKTMMINLLDGSTNIIKGGSLESISNILVPSANTYNFNYNLNKQTVSLPKCGGGTVSYPCKYDLQISVKDENNDLAPVIYNYTGIDTINFNQSLLLYPGSYSVRKTLSINQDSLQKFLGQYNVAGVGICKTVQAIADSIAARDSLVSNCGSPAVVLTSSACIASLGNRSTYLSSYASSINKTVAQLTTQQVTEIVNQYISDSSFCVSLNTNVSQALSVLRKQMLSDLMPNTGQYALDTVTNTSMYGKYNIFAGTGRSGWSQPLYKYPQFVPTPSIPDYYYNAQGNIDSTMLGITLQNISGTDYTAQYKESWAKSMLVYHPEYKKLKFAEDSLRTSFDFADSLQQVSSPFNTIASDPYFTIPSRISDKDTLTKYSNVSWTLMNGYSFWQLSYADAVGCKTIYDTLNRNNCYNNMPKVQTAVGTSLNNGIGTVTLTTAMQSQAWQMYKALYTQVRGDMLNRYINVRPGTTDTLDNASLIAQGYILHFPYSYAQSAQNFGLSWYPSGGGSGTTYNVSDSAKKYGSHCDGYIIGWRQSLLDCPALAAKDSASKEQILNSITSKMVQVCQKGTDGANPYGSSTVSPVNAGATFTSFEQVVNWVLDSAGITKNTLYCNPYGIEWPKPYGKNQQMSAKLVSALDTCTCSQWTWLKQQVTAAGYNAGNLTSINQYLFATYQDTITTVLYNGLQQCGGLYLMNCKSKDTTVTSPKSGLPYTYTITRCDTIYGVPLASPQPLPVFLNCGFTGNNCYSCAQFVTYENEFYTLFGKHPVFTGNITGADTVAWNQLYAKYVNFKTGLQKSWLYYADKFNSSSCGVGGITGSGNGLSICVDKKPLNDTTGITQTISPCQWVRIRALEKAGLVYQYQQEQLVAGFMAAYNSKCQSVTETFTATDSLKEYHYTLYYYDQAGNLVKTVPPKGVRPDYSTTFLNNVRTQRANMLAGLTWSAVTPQHSLVTRYNYNSLNQVILQKTPDAGVSKFYYDRLGRLVVSQNAKQSQASLQYSYTLYDPLGRITEVGQLTGGSAIIDGVSKDTTQLKNWLAAATSSRNQITQTVYDIAYGASPSSPDGLLVGYLTQRNLRNRVSYTLVFNNATDTYPASATYYSYDIHGNVDSLLQDFGNSSGVANAMNQSGNRFKKIVYDYDLISSKVNQVSYQPGSFDAYYHRYAYDAENRLTDVFTGRDSIMLQLFPEREAHYSYYKHGALARTELGQLKVQKQDYAYTLQGWLKAVNPVMGGTLANGTDTTEAYPTAQDVYGFGLNYFNNDYKAIGFTPQSTSILGALGSNAAPLYNGNIAAMVVNIPKLGSTKVYNYKFDQLNRLVSMDVFNGLNVNAGTFTPVAISDYQERVAYDPNGNILTYNRNGTTAGGGPLAMDSLTYQYEKDAGGQLISNKLRYVHDKVASTNYTDDIDSQTSLTLSQVQSERLTAQAGDNYAYDAIGNLIKDTKESITNISWSVYGKIQSITKSGTIIRYVYDAAGNRIMKQTPNDTTVYVRDAIGNVLSVYTRPTGGVLAQTELHLYGSNRLGMVTKHVATDTTISLTGGFNTIKGRIFTRGEKVFELSNHLGNVLVTITDRRMQNSAGSVTVDFYAADIMTANDYFVFGSQMPGRKYLQTSTKYRYGFNGKENDNEVKGEGNLQDYGMRIYDPRLGKFLSVDPLTADYPWYTPYQFAGNKPIWAVDLDGLEELLSNARLRVEAAKLGVVGNKRVGELFERVAVAAICGRGFTTFSNPGVNYPSVAREERNGINGPSAVRPDAVGLSITVLDEKGATNLKVGFNQFFEVKATSTTITKAYRKGQIEGMIDVLSEQSKLNGNKAVELVLIGTKDLKVGPDIFEYAKSKGVTISAIVAGVDDAGQIYFSDLRVLQSGQKKNGGVLDGLKDLINTVFGGGTFKGKPGWDLKDFTNGISNKEKGADPKKEDVPAPVSGTGDPDPIEIDDN